VGGTVSTDTPYVDRHVVTVTIVGRFELLGTAAPIVCDALDDRELLLKSSIELRVETAEQHDIGHHRDQHEGDHCDKRRHQGDPCRVTTFYS
jgi:hypothetical protein